MRKALFILMVHPVLLGVLGAGLKWLTKADDVAIIGSLLGTIHCRSSGYLLRRCVER